MGEALAKAVREIGEPVLIVASTDMSHHIPQVLAERLDQLAIDKILNLDPEGLFETVTQNDSSMCGVVPTTAALVAARELGGTSAKLVRYSTSAEVNGDRSAVVGYAGMTVR